MKLQPKEDVKRVLERGVIKRGGICALTVCTRNVEPSLHSHEIAPWLVGQAKAAGYEVSLESVTEYTYNHMLYIHIRL